MPKALFYIILVLVVCAASLFSKLNALFLFIAIVGIVMMIVARKGDDADRKFLAGMILAMSIIRFILALFVMEVRGESLSQDEGLYSKKALMYSYGMKGMRGLERHFFNFYDDSDMLDEKYGYNSYTRALSSFYYVFGYQIQAVRLINCLFSIFTFLFIFYTAKILFGREVARIAASIFAFFPSTTLWSVFVGTDMMVIFCISAYIFFLVKILKESRIRWLLGVAAVTLLVRSIRPYIATVFITVAFLALAYLVISRMTRTGRIAVSLAGLATTILLASSPLAPVVVHKAEKVMKVVISDQGGFAVADDSGYLIYPSRCYEDLRCDAGSLIKAYVKGMSYVLFAPFPWSIRSKLQLLAYPQVILWYFMLPIIIYGFHIGFKKESVCTAMIAAYCLFVLSIFALVEGNIGGLFRHKDMVIPFLLMFFALGITGLARKRELLQ